MDLKETEISELANFMGHTDKIHKAHYRLPIKAREIINISKLLEIAQGGDDSDNSDDGQIELGSLDVYSNSSNKTKKTRSGIFKKKNLFQLISFITEHYKHILLNVHSLLFFYGV